MGVSCAGQAGISGASLGQSKRQAEHAAKQRRSHCRLPPRRSKPGLATGRGKREGRRPETKQPGHPSPSIAAKNQPQRGARTPPIHKKIALRSGIKPRFFFKERTAKNGQNRIGACAVGDAVYWPTQIESLFIFGHHGGRWNACVLKLGLRFGLEGVVLQVKS